MRVGLVVPGVLDVAIGTGGIILAFSLDTTVNDMYNIGLIAEQHNILMVSCAFLITGAVFWCAGIVGTRPTTKVPSKPLKPTARLGMNAPNSTVILLTFCFAPVVFFAAYAVKAIFLFALLITAIYVAIMGLFICLRPEPKAPIQLTDADAIPRAKPIYPSCPESSPEFPPPIVQPPISVRQELR